MNEEDVTYFAETDSRNRRLKFGIKQKDRSKHVYVIGKTGMGKSTLLESFAIQDILNGNGLAFIDPHGKTADLLLEYIPKERINDVVYFAPFDMEYPISFNVMEDVGPERRHLVASGLMSAFKKIWVDAWSARMEYILGNIMLALLEYPGSTLIGVNRMLADKDYRKKIVDNITDPSVKSFWVDEYAKYTDKFAAEAAPAIQNKVGQFVANPLVRNIIGQPKSSFDIRKIMDEKKILIINLSKGRVGEANANLLGSMIITKIYLAAMSRADLNEVDLKKAPHFYLYVDEFQSFANESFADILSEARKYKLNLTIAHQYIEQMSEEVRAAVFGNVGTMITFRVGAYDAEVLEKEYAPQFTAEDLVNLQKYQMYLKLMIDEVTSPPFSASGMAPFQRADITYTKEIIEASRKNFSKPRYEVEEEIRQWHEDRMGENTQSGGSLSGGGNIPRKPAYGAREGQSSSQGGQVNKGGGGSRQNGAQNQRPSEGGQAFQRPSSGQSGGNNAGLERRDQRFESEQKQIFPGNSKGVQAPQQNVARRESQNSSQHESPQSENREIELRKAISLSYLKSAPEQKNDQKVAKPENIAALRDALLTVMKDAKVDTSSMEIKSEQPIEQISDSVQEPVNNKTTPQVEVQQQESIKKAPDYSNSVKNEQTQGFKQAASSQAKGYDVSSRQPSEVPEEVLKKILDSTD